MFSSASQLASDFFGLGLPWMNELPCFSDSLGVPPRPCHYLVLDEQLCMEKNPWSVPGPLAVVILGRGPRFPREQDQAVKEAQA